ncbi:uncharacterized protein LOC116604643 [Nematostella vectensis]|uniref:uncharacterized protein LOC116604643 n=1 Tax=Nematostella vectensis TaxID=45351 RepID=UPI0013901937|nr:uncharacterized protein LOC116604643 [Nematostella vectensis]
MAAALLGRRLVKTFTQTSPSLHKFSRSLSITVRNPVVARSRLLAPASSCLSCWRRNIADVTVDDERTKLREWVDKTKKGSWISRWISDVDEIESSMMSEEEYQEREKLIQKMTEMYFDNPSQKWDPSFFSEVFDTLIKFNDRIGVEIFLEMMKEMQVIADEEMIKKVECYLTEAREASWFEK